jgi:hypothetical protein
VAASSTDALAPAFAVCSDYSFDNNPAIFRRIVVAENRVFDVPRILPAPKIDHAPAYKPHPKLRKTDSNSIAAVCQTGRVPPQTRSPSFNRLNLN